MRIRESLAAAGVVALIVTGCAGGSSKQPASTTSSPPPASTATTIGLPPTTPATTTPAPATVACTTGDLAVSLSDLSAAAGTDFKELAFRNTTATACTLFGFPGVSFVDAGGHQIGAPVPRAAGPASSTVTVLPGSRVAALLAYHDVYVATTTNCQSTTAVGVRVYPPNNTASVIAPTSLMVCANAATPGTADVSPVTTLAQLHP